MRHDKLKKLFENGEINASELSKSMLNELMDEGLIELDYISKQKRRVVAKESFYRRFKSLKDLQDAQSRRELVQKGFSSKAKRVRVQDGLWLNGRAKVNGKDLEVIEGGALFLKEITSLSKDILIVGVENFENLLEVKRELYLFKSRNLLFFYRNRSFLEFIKEVENQIIYFGDFDLAGVAIYLQEIKRANSKAKLFIPENIEELISCYGNRELYIKQLQRYKNLKAQDQKTQQLIDLIHYYQKGLEQEFFIKG